MTNSDFAKLFDSGARPFLFAPAELRTPFIFITPMIAKKFYTGPRFRRHTIKAPDWQKILSTAHQIPNPFWRGFTVTFVLAFKEALEKRRAMAQ